MVGVRVVVADLLSSLVSSRSFISNVSTTAREAKSTTAINISRYNRCAYSKAVPCRCSLISSSIQIISFLNSNFCFNLDKSNTGSKLDTLQMDSNRSSSDSSGEKVENTQVKLGLESEMGDRYHSHTIRLCSIR